ncbi:Muramoyltetrapeptide carboxypeptidase LdcA (peptidoglycan recycling) [Actinokineospora alba]|uniref:Muramoyltetrapeptide carboxypeptidase LdcA (Peptidoglycan recycling) n=1 Tax=Actinokineospora alba TaxID=504798 RepID=A0A1H0W3L6_9PSEU|nr:S66 peptidase family protein [Actinokineospora alba]TDP67839.1 muramoyltetrapeptide carboxypeptidase LdcA involved in peptidoglycan recycling [Actinokineospora alba]SDI72736.1 Muramoyltetrapeptide carboxypeptidase LdcA (peptidoglycan recycling) [Actinokineospora alba]SDP85322.1 Muramoyltetrapeptide carboxypeptidase LdcA (peptidoglycan recycling) [Actinokineospora alba]
MRFPAPLKAGDRIGVTSPSSGVDADLLPRLEFAVEVVETRGYEVVVGECMDGAGHISAPAADRARELTAMLTDPDIRAVVPPWGGELAIDLLPLLDWDAIRDAEPTWVVGFSDMSTIITPLTLLTGVATIHGNNLMDTPYVTPKGLLSWLDIAALPTGSTFTQSSPGVHRSSGFDDYRDHPDAYEFTLDRDGRWIRLDGDGDVDVSGRLIGGCVEALCNLMGTRFGDTAAIPGDQLIYLEASGDDAATICRNLHGMRLAGFFDRAAAVLIGRTRAPGIASLSQYDAVVDALGCLGVPLVADVECGHVPPFLPLVNGALGRVVHNATESTVIQTLD